MKIFATIIFLFLFASCRTDGFIGKWQLKEQLSSDGAKNYTTSVRNGTILNFKANDIVEKDGKVGKYHLSQFDDGGYIQKRVVLEFDFEKNYYLYELNGTILSCTPVSSDFSIICDEGCADIYHKCWFN